MYRRKTLYAVEAPDGTCFVEGSRVVVVCKDGHVVGGSVEHVGATTLLINGSEVISIAMGEVENIRLEDGVLGGGC